ncbi:MAG: Hsp20/alpha crystallin family protein [Chloroflexota bacterium]|nr:Hsp20/alpha crystallin family protein [Chloroflexota bacterium]
MISRDLANSSRGSSLWRDMARLQEEINTLFSRVAGPRATTFPAFNLWTNDDSAIVTSELPGVDLNDLDLTVVGDTLTVRGARMREPIVEGSVYHRQERISGSFIRVLQLPFRVETEEVAATLNNGLLTVTLPQARADKPRKISIRGAQEAENGRR